MPPDEPGKPGGRRGRGQEAGCQWPRPRLPVRPDRRVGSDSKDPPHRSRGSYPPPAAAVRSANLVEWAIHLARGPSAEPPVLPPLRSPAAFVKAAHWPLLLCAACHALAWTPTSWCGRANAARKTRRCSGTQTWASPLSSAHRRGSRTMTAEVAPLLRLRCSRLSPSSLSPVLVQMWQG